MDHVVGLNKCSAGESVFDTTAHSVNETAFVLAAYTFGDGSTRDDIAQLWINPSPSTFGAASPPPPTLVASTGTDPTNTYAHVSQFASFVLFQRGSGNAALQPGTTIADELRVGLSWANVTPPASIGTAPAVGMTRAGSQIVLFWPRNATGDMLYSTPSVTPTINWSPAGTGTIVGTEHVVTNSVSSTPRYYRLQN
jgi:hypothetical protein